MFAARCGAFAACRLDTMREILKRTGRVIGAGAGAVTLLGLGYIAVTWFRCGKVARVGRAETLLDRFMPTYEVGERHETRVAAPALVTYRAACELDLQRSVLVRAIFRGRELLMGAERSQQQRHRRFLQEVLAIGWGVLAEEPGREIVFGAVTQPGRANVRFRALSPSDFAQFSEPGYAKIAWTLAAEPLGPNTSVFRTETRVATTDAASRRRFRRYYWAVFSPGILLIRRESRRLVRAEAEARGPR